jgi:hypothetical protein
MQASAWKRCQDFHQECYEPHEVCALTDMSRAEVHARRSTDRAALRWIRSDPANISSDIVNISKKLFPHVDLLSA